MQPACGGTRYTFTNMLVNTFKQRCSDADDEWYNRVVQNAGMTKRVHPVHRKSKYFLIKRERRRILIMLISVPGLSGFYLPLDVNF